MDKKSVFEVLSAIDCNAHTEKKNGLTYLSWAWAWGIVKQNYPTAEYKVYENEKGWNYFHDEKTAWVKTGVIIEGLEMIEYLPVMDFKNKSIGLSAITSFDVNKTIQRSLTKAIARHGLGLYIYAGEDLPENAESTPAPKEVAIDEKVIKVISDCKTEIELQKVWADNPSLQKNNIFVKLVTDKKKQLTNENK